MNENNSNRILGSCLPPGLGGEWCLRSFSRLRAFDPRTAGTSLATRPILSRRPTSNWLHFKAFQAVSKRFKCFQSKKLSVSEAFLRLHACHLSPATAHSPTVRTPLALLQTGASPASPSMQRFAPIRTSSHSFAVILKAFDTGSI